MNSAMFEETVIEVITSGAGYRSRPDLSKISSRVLRSRTSVACNRLSLNYPNVRRRGSMPQLYRGKRPIWKGMRDLYQGLRKPVGLRVLLRCPYRRGRKLRTGDVFEKHR